MYIWLRSRMEYRFVESTLHFQNICPNVWHNGLQLCDSGKTKYINLNPCQLKLTFQTLLFIKHKAKAKSSKVLQRMIFNILHFIELYGIGK